MTIAHKHAPSAARINAAWTAIRCAIPHKTMAEIAAITGLSIGQITMLSIGRCGRPTIEAAERWIATHAGSAA